MEEQASAKLLTLSQKENKDLYAYYYCTETLLIGISGKNQVTHNGENAIILNNTEQHILKDIITKFGFGLKISELCLNMIEYKANPIHSFYNVFKKAEAYLNIIGEIKPITLQS